MTEKTFEGWMVFDAAGGELANEVFTTHKPMADSVAHHMNKDASYTYFEPRRVRVTVLPDEGEGEQRGD